jgi:hypothetical protein
MSGRLRLSMMPASALLSASEVQTARGDDAQPDRDCAFPVVGVSRCGLCPEASGIHRRGRSLAARADNESTELVPGQHSASPGAGRLVRALDAQSLRTARPRRARSDRLSSFPAHDRRLVATARPPTSRACANALRVSLPSSRDGQDRLRSGEQSERRGTGTRGTVGSSIGHS